MIQATAGSWAIYRSPDRGAFYSGGKETGSTNRLTWTAAEPESVSSVGNLGPRWKEQTANRAASDNARG